MMIIVIILHLMASASQESTVDEIVRSLQERYGAPEEATVLREDEDALLVEAKPRFQDEDFQGSVVGGPAPPVVYLKLKIRGRECRAYWDWNHRKPTLDHTKEYRFLVSGPVDDLDECYVHAVWLGDEIIFEDARKKAKGGKK